MDTTSAIDKLKERISLVRRTLDYHKRRIIALEGESQRLAIALGVMEEIDRAKTEGKDSETGDLVDTDDLLDITEGSPDIEDSDNHKDTLIDPDDFVVGDGPSGGSGTVSVRIKRFHIGAADRLQSAAAPPTKHLIKRLFDEGKELSREAVFSEIKMQGYRANPGTVATTLSKLVGEGILKREGNKYVRASVDDTAADTDGSGDDLL